MTHPGEELRKLLARPGMVEAAGAHDALTARLCEQAEFDVLVVGAGATAAFCYGLPDVGLVSVSETLEQVRRIAAAVSIPVVADVDDGGGSAMHVRRTVRMAENAGATAVMLEDTDHSKKHLWSDEHQGWDFASDELLPISNAIASVRAAVDARLDERTVIIGRTDAFPIGGLADALNRAQAFAEAGADMIQFAHAPLEIFTRELVEVISVPIIHVPIDTPTLEERANLANSGVKLLSYFYPTLLGAFEGVIKALEDVKVGRRSPDGRSEWERHDEVLRAIDLKGWSALLHGEIP